MPEPALQTTALRYAARDLPPSEVTAFEERLSEDQEARDALAEAVRLSAAARCESAPRPGAEFRARLRERLSWGPQRALLWAAAGAAAVAVCTLVGLSLADRAGPPPTAPPTARATVRPVEPPAEPPAAVPVEVAPPPREAAPAGAEPVRSVAEIWADLSTPDHVEKARDDEHRLRQKMQSLAHPHHTFAPPKVADAP